MLTVLCRFIHCRHNNHSSSCCKLSLFNAKRKEKVISIEMLWGKKGNFYRWIEMLCFSEMKHEQKLRAILLHEKKMKQFGCLFCLGEDSAAQTKVNSLVSHCTWLCLYIFTYSRWFHEFWAMSGAKYIYHIAYIAWPRLF